MEENISVQENPGFNINITGTRYNSEKVSRSKPSFNPDNFSLTAEGGRNFFRYLKSFNLPRGSDLLILSPNSHYFYDETELKNVRTIINLKKLNLLEDPNRFLQTLFLILPPNVNFIGCFSDRKAITGIGFISEFSTRINNLLDAKTVRNLDKKTVSELLEKHGFKVIDMTEMSGLTYFYSCNVRQQIEIRA